MEYAWFALAALAVWRSGIWVERSVNAQQRAADGLYSIAGALLKRIEWEASCRRADAQERQAREAMEAALRQRELLREQRKLEVHDDLNLAPAAAELIGKLRARAPAAAPDVLYPGPKGNEPGAPHDLLKQHEQRQRDSKPEPPEAA